MMKLPNKEAVLGMKKIGGKSRDIVEVAQGDASRYVCSSWNCSHSMHEDCISCTCNQATHDPFKCSSHTHYNVGDITSSSHWPEQGFCGEAFICFYADNKKAYFLPLKKHNQEKRSDYEKNKKK